MPDGISHYILQTADDAGFTVNVEEFTVSDTSYRETSLQLGTRYGRVKAVDLDDHESDWSTPASVTLEGVLDLIAATPLAAYSVRQLSVDYTGPAIRVKNTDTLVQTDVDPGFTQADIEALGDLADIEVVKFYDQVGTNDLIPNANPKLYFASRPLIDFYGAGSYFESEDNVSVTAPKKFIVLDPTQSSVGIASFNDDSFVTRFDDAGATGNRSYSQNNGALVYYDSNIYSDGAMATRGCAQLTANYLAGTDEIRVNSAVLSKTSGTNAGDTASGSKKIRLGGPAIYGTIAKFGEFILFDGTVSDADRDIIEASQQGYFLDRNRLIFHGDSLVQGQASFPAREYSDSVAPQTRDLLGEGWDVYLRGAPGSSFTVSGGFVDDPAGGLIGCAPLAVDPLFRPDALNNILVLWNGWNDMSFNDNSAATFIANLTTYCAARRVAEPNIKIVVCPPPISHYSGQNANYLTRRQTVLDYLATNWFDVADAYADFSEDPVIGTAANTANTTYWSDELHMTVAGYALVAPYIADAITAMLSDVTAPSVPTSFAAGTPTTSSIPFTWVVSSGTPVAYEIRSATDSAFTLDVVDTPISGGGTAAGNVTGLDEGTLYYFKIRARDGAGNWSAYSSAISATTDEITPISPATLGADCIIFFDAEDYAVADGTTINDLVNGGSGPDYSLIAGTVTKETVSGQRVIRHGFGSVYQADSNLTGTANHTVFIIAKPASTTDNEIFMGLAASALTKGILFGFTDGFWMNYPESVSIAPISTTLFQLVTDDTGATVTGQWDIRPSAGDWAVIAVINRLLTPEEEAGITLWMNDRITLLNT